MIRPYTPADLEAIKALAKAQGFDYDLPDLSSPLVLVRKVREVRGRVVGAAFLRITAETFLLVQGSPATKARSILELQPAVIGEAWKKGLDDLVCVIPPEIAKSFGPVLEKLGWSRDRDWPMWSRALHAERGQSGQ